LAVSLIGDKQAAAEAVRQGAIAGWAEDYEILASFANQHGSLTVLGDESIGLKLDGIGVRENDSELRDAINYALQQRPWRLPMAFVLHHRSIASVHSSAASYWARPCRAHTSSQ
jgi:Bacterial extracellular solute-binding proteins, family 3